jgi:hypothetical protein
MKSHEPAVKHDVKGSDVNPALGLVVQNDSRNISDNVFERRHGVSDKVLDVLQKTYRGWSFRFGNGLDHSHPVGATERAICEELAYREIVGMHGVKVNIVDIGGNANRHFVAGRTNVHSCNPLLSSSDAVRRRPVNYVKGALYCDNTAQTCQLHPDVYLSVHSLYYLSQDEILNFVHRSRKGELKAVVHRFDKIYGGLHHNGTDYESKYSMGTDGKTIEVHMAVNGNCVGYTHDPCLWLTTNYYQSGGKAMAWDGKPIGDSWIYTFVAAKTRLSADRVKTMPLIDSLNRDNYHGKVDGVLSYGDQAKFKPVFDFLNIEKAEYVSAGSFHLTYKRGTIVTMIPKELIKIVALDMVGRPRDATTLRLCIDKMKSLLRKMDMPEDMKIKCATYGSALAFLYSLNDEILAFNNLCRPLHQRMYKRLQKALSLENFVCCSSTTFAQIDSELADMETVRAYNAERISVPAASFDAKTAWPKGLPGYESQTPLKPLKEGAWVKPHTNEEDNKEYGPQFHANCITFSNNIPLVPNPSKTNDLRALRNRACVDTPKEEPASWLGVHGHCRALLRDMERVSGSHDLLFKVWNSKFPESQQLLHTKAYCKLRIDGLEPTDFRMKEFVKRELTLKGGPVVEEFDPRSIQGCSDVLNVAYGPFIWHASKQLGKLWNVGERITYASGLTAEELGEWRLQFDSDLEVTIIELDESRYDAHQARGCHTAGRIFKDHAGIIDYEYATAVENQIYLTTGVSRHHKYSVNGTMTSGRADTSCSNSFVNGAKLDYFLLKFGFKKSDYKMVVNGDDSLVVVRKALSAHERNCLQNFLTDENLKLGFTSKCKVRTEWYEVEFCSSLFWPVAGGYVLGPKIGRRLPKIGFNLNELSSLEIDGMLTGLNFDVSHIPVLSEYVVRAKFLLKKNKNNIINKNQKMYKNKEAPYQIRATKLHTCTYETDVFFEQRYGLDSTLARSVMSQTLSTATCLTSCVDFPLMEIFTRVDV